MQKELSNPGLLNRSDVKSGKAELRLSFGVVNGNESGVSGQSDLVELRVATPLLGGPAAEVLFQADGYLRKTGDWSIIDSGNGEIAGVASLPFSGEDREEVTRELYLQLTSLVEDRHIYRIWNFVPDINGLVDELENYRAFNVGRWKAFEESGYLESGGRCHPAASAVGVNDGNLSIAFLAGAKDVQYFENPAQIPAWQYPNDYGPKSPCFVRGAVAGESSVFLSGTASILGHASRKKTDLDGQFETTLANVDRMLAEMGTSRENTKARFRVYIRNEADFVEIQEKWQQVVSAPVFEETCFLLADICREELLLEVEAIVEKA